MNYKIELTANWRPNRRSFYTPGVYRVPEDMPGDMAERAVKEAGAKRAEVSKPKPTFLGSKAISTAPENKAKMVGSGGGGGDGAVPHAGGRVIGFGTKGSRGK